MQPQPQSQAQPLERQQQQRQWQRGLVPTKRTRVSSSPSPSPSPRACPGPTSCSGLTSCSDRKQLPRRDARRRPEPHRRASNPLDPGSGEPIGDASRNEPYPRRRSMRLARAQIQPQPQPQTRAMLWAKPQPQSQPSSPLCASPKRDKEQRASTGARTCGSSPPRQIGGCSSDTPLPPPVADQDDSCRSDNDEAQVEQLLAPRFAQEPTPPLAHPWDASTHRTCGAATVGHPAAAASDANSRRANARASAGALVGAGAAMHTQRQRRPKAEDARPGSLRDKTVVLFTSQRAGLAAASVFSDEE